MSDIKNVVVFGATGKQGKATVQQYRIFAVTRDPSSAKAAPLASLTNVQLVQGDASSPEDVFAAVAGKVYGVFFAPVGFDADAQAKEGLAVIDTSVKNGVEHFVFSSTDFSGHRDKESGIPAIEAKKRIEDYLLSVNSGLRVTILRPVGFMENLFFPGFADAIPFLWPTNLLKSAVAASDIGRAASEIFERPEEFAGKIVELSGFEGKPDDWIKVWREVKGEDLRQRVFKPSGGMSEGQVKMLKFINANECDARMETSKATFPWLTDLKTFLEQS
ncbi:hypothetical protein IAT40_000180 [Kwoniella sp. CBS 6097]